MSTNGLRVKERLEEIAREAGIAPADLWGMSMLDFAARLAAVGATLPAPATCGAIFAGIAGACGLPDGHKGLCENDPRKVVAIYPARAGR